MSTPKRSTEEESERSAEWEDGAGQNIYNIEAEKETKEWYMAGSANSSWTLTLAKLCKRDAQEGWVGWDGQGVTLVVCM